MEYYQLDAIQFAQLIQVEPSSFSQLITLQPVEAEVVLVVIDQLHHRLKLDFNWFLTYDLAIIPDLSECLHTLLYNRDGMARRIKARREWVQWMMHGLIDELGSGIADPDSREVYSSNWTMGKLE